ncbi:MAG: hypothetical protein DRQ55_15750 [Planctomycetota bacterium]|nr:MAG: hypothetical protein DRQ55_15750 [Planctomycetota bacterium]
MSIFLISSLLAAALLGPTPAEDRPERSSLVIITLDTTRADHLGTYGHYQRTTPQLDALARKGVVFERAYAPMAQTVPSHSTLFSGLWPRQHGATENHLSLPDGVTTLAETLAGEGYDTAAFIAARVLEAESGLAQGFDVFGEPSRNRAKHGARPADAVVDEALAWAGRHDRTRPFLLWVHLFDVHAPYEPPEAFAEALRERAVGLDVTDRFERKAWTMGAQPPRNRFTPYTRHILDYDRELAFVDQQVGRLVRGLTKRQLMPDAALIVVGDHGEGLFEHGILGHGLHVHEELVHVPLIVVPPQAGSLAGTRVADPISLRDVRGLALRLLLGDGADPHLDGRDAWTSLLRTGKLPLQPVFLERPHYTEAGFLARLEHDGPDDLLPGELLAVVMGGLKLVRFPSGSEQLFDLDGDPDELRDIVAEHPKVQARLARLLDRWLADQPDPTDPERGLSEERRKALEQLGYGR